MTATRTVPRQGRPPKISRRDVVGAAVALADEGGLEAVTMRAVAGRLGVAPMTLYGHVGGADELIDLVVGATIADAVTAWPAPAPGRGGRGALIAFANGLRGMLLAHPAVLDVYRRRPVQDPGGLAVTDAVVSALIADGLDQDAAIGAYAGVLAFVVGFVSLEARPVDIDPAALERFPNLRRSGRLADLFDASAFDHGLTALVDAALPPTTTRSRSRRATASRSTGRAGR